MRVVNNTKKIARRAKIAQIANLGGLVILGAGLVISLTRPQYAFYTLGLLIIGVLASQYGIVQAFRYVRKPRPDEELADALKGLDDRYRLYNYVFPAHHVMLSPKKLYTVVLKSVDGKVICEGGKWRQDRRFSIGRILRVFSPEVLGNPVREAEWDRDAMTQWLGRNAEGVEVVVEPLVVFLNPRADLDIRGPEVTPVKAKGLKDLLRKDEGRAISAEKYRELARVLDQAAGSEVK